MPPRRKSRIDAEVSKEYSQIRREIIDIQNWINFFSSQRSEKTKHDARFKRESPIIGYRLKLLSLRLHKIDSRYAVISCAVEKPSDLEIRPDVDDDPFTIDGYEVIIPPSSGNLIYESCFSDDSGVDYCDGELFGTSPSIGDPIYDDYFDEEVNFADDFSDPEPVVEDCMLEPIDPILLAREVSVAPQTLEIEEVGNMVEFPVDDYLDPYDISVPIPACALLKSHIGVIYDDVYHKRHMKACSLVLVCMNWKRCVMRNGVASDYEFVSFPLMLQRYFIFVWKPGWSLEEKPIQHQIRGRILSAPERMM